MNGIRHRSNVGRIAIPIEETTPPASAPSLVPADVWESWQQELAEAAGTEAEEELQSASGIQSGLISCEPADFEVALLALSRVSVFSKLDREGLSLLAVAARQGELHNGEYLFREEAYAHSFYVVLDGSIEILRRTDGREVALRHLDPGDPVGLFGLLSGQRRAACARAIGDVLLLEIPAVALNDALSRHEGLRDRVMRFFRERLLEGFVGSTRLFSDVDSIARARIIGLFGERQLAAGEVLVNPGEVSNLLAVVLRGTVNLELKPRPGAQPTWYDLFPGEFVAVTAAFSASPCRIRIFSADGAKVALLNHRALSSLLRDYPALRAFPQRLSRAATQLDRDVTCGHCAVPGL